MITIFLVICGNDHNFYLPLVEIITTFFVNGGNDHNFFSSGGIGQTKNLVRVELVTPIFYESGIGHT